MPSTSSKAPWNSTHHKVEIEVMAVMLKQGPRIVAGVRQSEAACVPQHVRVDWKRHASALPEALHERVKTLRRHRAPALRSKHVRARRLFALKPAQGADLVTLNRTPGVPPLAAADMQTAGGELNLVPLKIAQLAGHAERRSGSWSRRDDHSGSICGPRPSRFRSRRPSDIPGCGQLGNLRWLARHRRRPGNA
jgi:hypothetical protein